MPEVHSVSNPTHLVTKVAEAKPGRLEFLSKPSACTRRGFGSPRASVSVSAPLGIDSLRVESPHIASSSHLTSHTIAP